MNKFHKGFTLIELVVVIAILGILAGIAIPRFLDAQASAKGAKIVADLRTINSAAMVYNVKNGKYPDAITSATPSSTDGFVNTYLKSWPVPGNTGKFIVAQLIGGSKTFTSSTSNYTLTSDGRAEYDGHTVEYYLGLEGEDSLLSKLGEWLNQSGKSGSIVRLDSENQEDTDVKDITKYLGELAGTSTWALTQSGNTYTLYVADHKLTQNKDWGKTINVLIYTGSKNSNNSITWNTTPSAGTRHTQVWGTSRYIRINVYK